MSGEFLLKIKRAWKIWFALFLISLLKPVGVFAQDFESDQLDELLLLSEENEKGWSSPLNEFGLTGSLRTGYWSSNRLSDNDGDFVASSVWLKLDKRLRRGLTLYSEAYVYDEDTFGGGRSTDRQIKEAYLHFRSGDWDYRLGRQIVAWGRADRLNPTDNLTPRDFTLLYPEIDEDRFGTEAIKISKIFGSYSTLG